MIEHRFKIILLTRQLENHSIRNISTLILVVKINLLELNIHQYVRTRSDSIYVNQLTDISYLLS